MRPLQVANFNMGGIGDSDYMGREGSVAEMVGLDVHSEPGAVRAMQKLSAMSGSNFPSEFCKIAVNCSNGRIYWFSSESGKIWEDNAGTWTLKLTTAPKNGETKILGALEFDGFLYWGTQNFLHRIKVSKASGTWNTANSLEENYADFSLDQELPRKTPVALKFDGVDDRLDISSFALNHTDVTFSCWFFVEEDTSDTKVFTIWGANNTSSNMQVELGGDTTVAPNRNRIAIRSGSTIVAQSDSNAFEANTWNHLVYTRSTNTHKIYVNGVERATVSNDNTTFANATNARYIGTRDSSNTNPLKGFIADLRIQTTVLTAQQALDTYEGKEHITSNTLVYYPLNNSLRDYQGSNHATASGNPTFFYIVDFEIPFRTELATSLSEIDTDRKFFKANSETIDYIKIWVAEPGSGSLTITIHDFTNTIVGSAVTVTNGNLVAGWNYVAMNISDLSYGATYHIHVHGSASGTFLKSNNYNDISDAFFELLSDGDSEFHTMLIQNLVLFIGDRNYIHQVDKNRSDGTHIFTSRALDIPYPLRVKSLGRISTDLLVGTIVDARISKTQIYRWNTWSQSWSVSDEIPEEGINAFIDADNYVIVNAGTAGNRYFYNGQTLELMGTMKGDFEAGGKVTVHPNAAANFKGLALFGLSNVSGNPVLQGVYSYGSRNADYPPILTLAYPISQRSSGNFVTSNIEIGAILVVGNDLYVSWKDTNSGTVVGIDKLDYTNKLSGAYFTTLVMDVSRVYLNNYKQFIIKYISLPTDTDITMEYKVNFGTWKALTSVKDALKLQKRAELTLQAAPLQWRVKLTCDDNVSPKFSDGVILVD